MSVTDPGSSYEIGAPVSCEDGPCGALSSVVVDPLKNAVTHLVVEPGHRHSLARLVPVGLIDPGADPLQLRCTAAAFRALQYAVETDFLPPGDPWIIADYPSPGSFPGAASSPGPGMLLWPRYRSSSTVRHDVVPVGEVEIRRGDHVHATDGHIGRVQGLVVGFSDQHVTHVLLQEGHLWGTRNVAIPIGAITAIGADGVISSLSKREIGALPEIEGELPSPVQS